MSAKIPGVINFVRMSNGVESASTPKLLWNDEDPLWKDESAGSNAFLHSGGAPGAY